MNQDRTEKSSNYEVKGITKKNFLFSIIIPIYNVEKYIAETIESVINQTLDFKEHVHLIIVNDGSPDNSEEICLPYIKEYPENITYIKKENGGVSSARNLGLNYVQGEYVNFLDSDDKLEDNVLETVYGFFLENEDKVDLVAIPIKFFDGQDKEHILNYKFKNTQIIDVEENPDCIQLSSCTSFIKSEIAKKYQFDSRLKYAEDAKYITEIILEKMKYGAVSNARYLYRKRQDGTSAIQQSLNNKSWYLDTLYYFSEELIKMCYEKLGYLPSYVQNVIMYDLQWKFKVRDYNALILSQEDKMLFIQKLSSILKNISDDVIFNQRFISKYLKIFAVELKEGKSNLKYIKVQNDIKVYLNNRYLYRLSDEKVIVDLLEIKKQTIQLEGHLLGVFSTNEIEIDVYLNKKIIETFKVKRPHDDMKFLGDSYREIYGFKAEIKIEDIESENRIYFKLRYKEIELFSKYELGKKVNFSKVMPSYYAKDKLLLHPVKNYINIIPNNFFKHLRKELGMFKRLFNKRDKYALQAIFIRTVYYFCKILNKKPIHLYMDRVTKAGDNAEALFKYSMEQNEGIRKFFILSKESPDYERISRIGRVIPYGSRKHRLYMLLANKLISSHADEIITNPFGNKGLVHYKDLMDYDFIFLQHGVIIHDISSWIHKHSKNIQIFVTSAQSEYNSIIERDYGYSEKEVKLLGLPRFDSLQSRPEKKILIMPTWRKELAGDVSLTGEWGYNPNFKNSLYYHTFNKLLNDDTLLRVAEKFGYKIVFYPHPNITAQLKDFDIPPSIEIADKKSNYSDYFNSSNLLVTDYSSVAYDFAYQKKPIIYYHFESFHWDMGYFDYEDMGFGEIHSTHEGLVNKIRDYIENNCEMEPVYKNRVNEFYKFTDTDNCKRVYEEINKI